MNGWIFLPVMLSLVAGGGDPFDIDPGRGLPREATVLEARRVPSKAHPDRGLVLWMESPQKNPRVAYPDEPYTCPEKTRGSFYSGRAFVSLVDVKTLRVLDTLAIEGADSEGDVEGGIDLPYQILAGSYYLVEHPGKSKEGKPTLLDLRDVNGDGRAQEFVLYDAFACMGLGTTLIGYSEKQDQMIQYPVFLTSEEDGEKTTDKLLWADYLFSKKPVEKGHWRYEIDYSGRGGCVDSYDVRYDAASESFKGTLRSSECSEDGDS
jgi:hypothetical protein